MTHMNDYLPERLATNPLQAMESDSDIEAIADAVISASVLRDECDGDAAFKKSARQLLYACLGYLRDWCSLEQRTVGNLKALLDAARPSSSGSTVTDLGDLFYEIESGCKRVISADGITMSWEPTALERNDGTCPRDTNGIRPEDDFCLGCYKRFAQGTAPTTRASIAVSLSRALPGREGSLTDALKAVPVLLHVTYHPSMVLGTAPPVPFAIYNHSKLQNNIDGYIETHNSIITWEALPPSPHGRTSRAGASCDPSRRWRRPPRQGSRGSRRRHPSPASRGRV